MRLMLAIFVPWLGLLTIGKPFQAFFCFLLQWTFIGWLPAIIWSTTAVAQYYGDKKMDRFAEAIKASRPADAPPVVVNVQTSERSEDRDAPRPFEVQRRRESAGRSEGVSIGAGSDVPVRGTNERDSVKPASTTRAPGRTSQDTVAGNPELSSKLFEDPEFRKDAPASPTQDRALRDERLEEATSAAGFQSRASENKRGATRTTPSEMTGWDQVADRFEGFRTLFRIFVAEFATRKVVINLLYLLLAVATFAFVPQVHDWVINRMIETYDVGGRAASGAIEFIELHLITLAESGALVMLALTFVFYGRGAGAVGALGCAALVLYIVTPKLVQPKEPERQQTQESASPTKAIFLAAAPKRIAVQSGGNTEYVNFDYLGEMYVLDVTNISGAYLHIERGGIEIEWNDVIIHTCTNVASYNLEFGKYLVRSCLSEAEIKVYPQ